jgi:hypothetical protein
MPIRMEDGFAQWFDVKSNTVYVCSSLPLSLGKIVQNQSNVVVEADEILVQNRVDFGGRSIKLTCRQLTFQDKAILASSGRQGKGFAPDVRPAPKSGYGENGVDGSDGEAGQAGGDIQVIAQTIVGDCVIESVGGIGGRGQDGGHGTSGRPGEPGHRLTWSDSGDIPPLLAYSGGTGGPAGSVGLPGLNGSGGAAGQIAVKSLLDSGSKFTLREVTGAYGENASPGRIGTPGSAGWPGTLTKCILVGRDRLSTLSSTVPSEAIHDEVYKSLIAVSKIGIESERWVCSTSTGELGEIGAAGSTRDDEVAERQQYKPEIVLDIQPAKADLSAFAFTELYLELLASGVEDTFRATGQLIEDDVSRLKFHLSCLAPHSTDSNRVYFNRLYSLIYKASRGFDYYGFTQDQVTVFSVAGIEKFADRLLPALQIIEHSYAEIILRTEKQEDITSPLQKTLSSALSIRAQLDRQAGEQIDQLKAAQSQFPASLVAIELARQELLKAGDALQVALIRMNRCDWQETLLTVGSIAIAAYTAGASVAAAGAAKELFVTTWNENNKSLQSLWDAREILSKNGKTFIDATKDLKGAITDIRTAAKGLNDASKALSLPEIEVSREQFDAIVQQYADLPEAKVYRDLGYVYLARIEARHKAIAAYEAGLLRLSELVNQAALVQQAADEADAALKRTDLTLSSLLPRLWSMRRAAIDAIAKLLHSHSKAVSYHFGEYSTPKIATRTSAELNASRIAITDTWLSRKEQFRPARKSSEPIAITLKEFALPKDWVAFAKPGQETRALIFTINPDRWPMYSRPDGRVVPVEVAQLLASYTLLRITGIAMQALVGGKVVNVTGVRWSLTHAGYEKMLIAPNQTKSFSRLPWVSKGAFSDSFKPDRSDEGLYSGVSPFATWRLIIEDPYANLQGALSDINMLVDGYVVD